MEFSKPALNAQQHLDLLIERGLKVSNQPKALHFISNIGYYRLSGYMYPLQVAGGTHKFKENITFELITDYYNFDRKLRFLILDFIERIEVGLRAILSDTFAIKYGSHWYLDPNLFKKTIVHANFVTKVKSFCNECDFQFIKSYQMKYDTPPEPPCWMIMETLTLGQLSVLFENLKGGVLKSEVAAVFLLKLNCCNIIKPLVSTRGYHKFFMKFLNF
jgi:abortive infection bacteriophage resistance protein